MVIVNGFLYVMESLLSIIGLCLFWLATFFNSIATYINKNRQNIKRDYIKVSVKGRNNSVLIDNGYPPYHQGDYARGPYDGHVVPKD